MTVAPRPRVDAPATPADCATLLADATRDGAAVVIEGGATLPGIGNRPERCDLRLSTAALDGIMAYDPRDLTIGVGAGMTVAALLRTLRADGLMLPFDVPHPARATVGGTLASGWLGPRRGTYGRLRDVLIGTTAALCDGSLASAGGMVVKNVTGYDMSKVYVGSLGTLGAIVRANFKTLARPAASRLAAAAVPPDSLERVAAGLDTLAIEPTALLLVDGFRSAAPSAQADVQIIAVLEGTRSSVDRATRDLRSALGKAGVPATELYDDDAAESAFANIVDAYVAVDANGSLTYRSLGLPSTAFERSTRARMIAHDLTLTVETIADLRNGDLITRFSGRDAAALRETSAELDTRVHAALARTIIIAGTPDVRAGLDAWGPPPATLATMRALKQRFDPQRTLAPGRYVGGI